jgi:hypothetical protein
MKAANEYEERGRVWRDMLFLRHMRAVSDWNRLHGVGTSVLYYSWISRHIRSFAQQARTTSEARLSSRRTAIIDVEIDTPNGPWRTTVSVLHIQPNILGDRM